MSEVSDKLTYFLLFIIVIYLIIYTFIDIFVIRTYLYKNNVAYKKYKFNQTVH